MSKSLRIRKPFISGSAAWAYVKTLKQAGYLKVSLHRGAQSYMVSHRGKA